MTTSPFLITGAPGNVGSEVIAQLRGKAPIRAAVIDVDAARAALGTDLDYVRFNFLDPDTFAETFSGVKKMFLVRPPQLAKVDTEIFPALEAAVKYGVQHIVFLSLQGVENNRRTPHHKIELWLKACGIKYTFLRASFFMQNLTTTHRQEIRDLGRISVPVGAAKTSFIDARDIGAVAARVMLEAGHENRAYTLTGAEALDYYTVAYILSETLGKPIEYTNPNPIKFFWEQLHRGRRAGFALVMTMLYTITRQGNASLVTDDVKQVLGRKPISFRQFAQDYRTVWHSAQPALQERSPHFKQNRL